MALVGLLALGALASAASLRAQVVEPVAEGLPRVLLVGLLWDTRASPEGRADCPASYLTVFILASEGFL